MKLSSDTELMSFWDDDKNHPLGLEPEKLQAKSNKKAWWKCLKGHSWQREIYRQNEKRSCPYCTNKQVLIGFNDLQTLYPDIAQEWDFANNPKDISAYVIGSAQKVWWKCSKCGIRWKTAIRARTQRGSGCPNCAKVKRAETRHNTNLKTKNCLSDPLLLKEWDSDKNMEPPSRYFPGSNKKVWWKCSRCGYGWQAKISNRAILRRACPCCANKIAVTGKNDLATAHPDLAKEWHPTKNGNLTPQQVLPGSSKKVWWLCPSGHEYRASLLHRVHGTNCPVCNSGRQTSFAEQAVFYYISQIFPDAKNRVKGILRRRMELDIYIPTKKLAIEYDGVFWHKDDDYERELFKYHECQRLGIKLIRIKESENSLISYPIKNTADEIWHVDKLYNKGQLSVLIQFLLDKLDPRSNMFTRETCCFHSPIDINVERDEFKIRQYMHKLKDDNLELLYPALVSEWNYGKNEGLTPAMFAPGSSLKVWWKCPTCGHEWKTSICHRTKGNSGCPVCYRKEMKVHHPEAVSICQYTKDGAFIKKWNSIAEAARILKINASNIGMAAKHIHGRRYAGGYRWEYYKNNTPQFIQPNLLDI